MPHSRHLRGPRVRSWTGGAGGCPASDPRSVALPRGHPPAGLRWDALRGEPAITGLDWSFAPRRGSWERIARQHPFGPPPGDTPGFTLPPPRSPGFWSHSRDYRPLSDPAPRRGKPSAAGCRFPYGFGGKPLSLATAVNSPARVSRRTVRPRSPLLVLPGRPGFLRRGSSLSGRTVLRRSVSGSFHPPSGVLFSFPSRYLVRYRSWDVFSLGGWCPPASHGKTKPWYSGRLPRPPVV